MARIERGMLAVAILLAFGSLAMLSNRDASAQAPGYFCDFTPAGMVLCNCSDNGNGTVCASFSNVTLQWCTTTASATCVSPNGKNCPSFMGGTDAYGDCSSYTYSGQLTSCTGNLRGNCVPPSGTGPGGS
jgi:hypothetical protein